ncbi:MAG: 4-alpha-glucanotransferase, partial [Candidatus Dormibacterales bacterium]
ARVARPGEPLDLRGPAQLLTEAGVSMPLGDRVPAGLQPGYHVVQGRDGTETPLIVSPGVCPRPGGRAWGWAVQLHCVRSGESWGIGDLDDLRRLGRWSAELGAGLLVLSPLHAPAPTSPQEPSPYFPSSRLFRNPLHLALERVPGAERLGARLAGLLEAGRALNSSRRIDRDRVLALKMEALEALWERFGGATGFDEYRRSRGLQEYATYCALAELHGPAWRRWPARFRHPRSPAVADFARALAGRVGFHAWLQWLLDAQLEEAAREIPLMQDLAVGFSLDGADAWAWQDLLAPGVEVGAPPDEFNTGGQRWGLAPFDPWKLRSAGYGPYIDTLRACLRHGAGLRIDHVMGLFRLFWIPAGAGPESGAYVTYPARDLLDILALESARAGAYVVGEDLGTVDEAVRSELAARSVLSYRVLWFEARPTSRYPSRALAAITTHDLPTVAGLMTGSDLALQERLGLGPNLDGALVMRRRLLGAAGLPEGAGLEEVLEAAHRALARCPSVLVVACLEDLAGVAERPNMPGTTRPENWSLALPSTLEEMAADARSARLARALRRDSQPA